MSQLKFIYNYFQINFNCVTGSRKFRFVGLVVHLLSGVGELARFTDNAKVRKIDSRWHFRTFALSHFITSPKLCGVLLIIETQCLCIRRRVHRTKNSMYTTANNSTLFCGPITSHHLSASVSSDFKARKVF